MTEPLPTFKSRFSLSKGAISQTFLLRGSEREQHFWAVFRN